MECFPCGNGGKVKRDFLTGRVGIVSLCVPARCSINPVIPKPLPGFQGIPWGGASLALQKIGSRGDFWDVQSWDLLGF